MNFSAIPTKMTVVWGAGAGGSYIRVVPVPSQIGVTPGAASFTDGFPPVNFSPVGAGGTPPFGQDVNGALNAITAWAQWYQAGGPISYDSTFQASVGGYPQGAIVMSATTLGRMWLTNVDANTTNPDAAGAGWTLWPNGVANSQLANMAPFTVKVNNTGSSAAPQDVAINTLTKIISAPQTVASLNMNFPAASYNTYRAVVTDAAGGAVWAAVASGGGTATLGVLSNGTAWIYS